ncbi:MAG: hypothetical protein KAQ63_00830 [Candidatus Moranbacteria bacterium]|nr:hypothetical protein [Candidatus Moranbacteria bacterium]
MLNLVLTLNILATILIAMLLVAIFIFSKSFSKGWLFLLGIVLLFPAVRLNSGGLSLFDLLLSLIAIIGMIKLALTDKRILKNKLTFPFFLLFLISSSYLFFGFMFGLLVKSLVWKIALNMIMLWFLLVGFQYFFQTQKRIKRFFSLLISIAVVHSVFGIVMFLGGWQTSIGMGISTGKSQHLISNQANHQVNGFLGIGLEDQIGANPLASLLVISIISTLGFLILNKQQEKVLIKKKVGRKKKIRLLDGVYRVKRFKGKFKTRKLFRRRVLMAMLLLIQFVALFLTFSYSSLVFLGIGVMVMGILIKHKRLITWTMVYLVILTMVLPSIHSSIEIISRENLSQWFGELETIKNNWIFGGSITSKEGGFISSQANQGNSYLLLWSTYGLLGLAIFFRVLWCYFADIYKKYESTTKGERIWFVIVASCFVSLLLEGLTSNILIFGPTAVIFWLMYGIILNLGKDNINDRFKKINFKHE